MSTLPHGISQAEWNTCVIRENKLIRGMINDFRSVSLRLMGDEYDDQYFIKDNRHASEEMRVKINGEIYIFTDLSVRFYIHNNPLKFFSLFSNFNNLTKGKVFKDSTKPDFPTITVSKYMGDGLILCKNNDTHLIENLVFCR